MFDAVRWVVIGGLCVTGVLLLGHAYLASPLPGAQVARGLYDSPGSKGMAWSAIDLFVPTVILANLIGRLLRLEWRCLGKIAWILFWSVVWMGALVGLLALYARAGLWAPPRLRAPGNDELRFLVRNYALWLFMLVILCGGLWVARAQEQEQALGRARGSPPR